MKSAWLVLLAACALTSKSTPIELRYFSPEPPAEEATAARAGTGRLRLARVTASAHLRNRIASRRSGVEVQLYDTLRWTEPPGEYVRRSLAHALFEQRGLEQVIAGPASTLTVEVVAFEEVIRGTGHFGRVQLRYELDDEQRVIATDLVTVERPAASADISAVASAIGAAMQAATSAVADEVTARLNAT